MKPHQALWFVPLLLAGLAAAAEPDPELTQAEKTLAAASVATDGPALLRFFRDRTLSEADRLRLADAVQRLGHDDFDTREQASAELVRAGRLALPFLKTVPRDPDPERARRIDRCREEIVGGTDLVRVLAAARVLADRRPAGAADVLLAYLPGADDPVAEEAVLHALLAVGVTGGQPEPALVAALADKEPLPRAAAAHVLGRRVPGQRPAVRKLLADTEPRVRFEAATALTLAGDKEAVPALIDLLEADAQPLAWQAQELLYRIAGDKAPAVALGPAGKRAAAVAAWRAWWKEAGPGLDLAALRLENALQGINLICEAGKDGRGLVWACRGDGKPLWEIKGVLAWDARLLPSGRILIAEQNPQRVTERDRAGNILWSKAVTSTPSTCQRLPDGNTLITTYSELLVVDPKGAVVASCKAPDGGLIARAHRLRNGHYLFACGGQHIIELDDKFKEVRRLKADGKGDSWISVEPLPGDRFLVAPYGARKVYEINAAGEVLWECPAPCPGSAVRLPNGNTLVACNEANALIEFSRDRKEIWRLQRDGRVHCIRRY